MVDLKNIVLEEKYFENKNSFKAALYALDICIAIQEKAKLNYKIIDEGEVSDIKFNFKRGNELIMNNTWIFGDVRGLHDSCNTVYVTKKAVREYLSRYNFIEPKNILSFKEMLKKL